MEGEASSNPPWLLIQGNLYTGVTTPSTSTTTSTGTSDSWSCQSLLAHHGRIVFVGSEEGAHQYLQQHGVDKEQDKVVTIQKDSGLFLPGFIDAHCHPLAAGTKELMAEVYCDVSHARDLQHALQLCREYCQSHHDGDGSSWVLGGGWRDDWFNDRIPKSHVLDEVFGPDRAVILRRWDMHAIWCSTKALELSGILHENTSPPCPKGGTIIRTSDRKAVGVLYDDAQDLVMAAFPHLSHEVRVCALHHALTQMARLGITGYMEAMVKNPRQHAVYVKAYEGSNNNHVGHEPPDPPPVMLPWGSLAWRCQNLHDVDYLKAHATSKEARGEGRLHLFTAKLMVDGVMESRTASLHEPYRDPDGSSSCCCGVSNFDKAALRDMVVEIDKARLSTHHHVVGDKACTDALDAIQAALEANGPWDSRHTLAHLQLVRPDDLPRFSHLKVVANFTPSWLCTSREMEAVINPSLAPPERVECQYPVRTLVEDEDVHVSFGSDWPVDNIMDPVMGIEMAVTHRAPGLQYPAWLPHQCLTVEQAIGCYTKDAAYACFMDDVVGTLEVGKWADLIWIDHNLFTMEPSHIHKARVRLTIIQGKIVHHEEHEEEK